MDPPRPAPSEGQNNMPEMYDCNPLPYSQSQEVSSTFSDLTMFENPYSQFSYQQLSTHGDHILTNDQNMNLGGSDLFPSIPPLAQANHSSMYSADPSAAQSDSAYHSNIQAINLSRAPLWQQMSTQPARDSTAFSPHDAVSARGVTLTRDVFASALNSSPNDAGLSEVTSTTMNPDEFRKHNTEKVLRSCGLYDATVLTGSLVKRDKLITSELNNFKQDVEMLIKSLQPPPDL